ncbi:hypothetical protein CAOG_009434 [Capsaspora owczarzaki ATCC 30864]|uniref:Uncharacterized protein n=2 Tax=Capsaspora owczarzaki (strain ATCC 30864) TaxID=595528 RepID=A0A0D2WKN1_CAPO3|nr:hypothetical protein CAOG_009434 [Capsaspora owczarzaki ATCC 30864]
MALDGNATVLGLRRGSASQRSSFRPPPRDAEIGYPLKASATISGSDPAWQLFFEEHRLALLDSTIDLHSTRLSRPTPLSAIATTASEPSVTPIAQYLDLAAPIAAIRKYQDAGTISPRTWLHERAGDTDDNFADEEESGRLSAGKSSSTKNLSTADDAQLLQRRLAALADAVGSTAPPGESSAGTTARTHSAFSALPSRAASSAATGAAAAASAASTSSATGGSAHGGLLPDSSAVSEVEAASFMSSTPASTAPSTFGAMPATRTLDDLAKDFEERATMAGTFTNPSLEEEYIRKQFALRRELEKAVHDRRLVRCSFLDIAPESRVRVFVIFMPTSPSLVAKVTGKLKNVEEKIFIRLVRADTTRVLTSFRQPSALIETYSGIYETGGSAEKASPGSSAAAAQSSSAAAAHHQLANLGATANEAYDSLSLRIDGRPLPVREIPTHAKLCRSTIHVTQKHINFGSLMRNEQRARSLHILNGASVPLLYRIQRNGSVASSDLGFSEGRLGVIVPFGSRDVNFVFRPTMAGRFDEPVTIENVQDPANFVVLQFKANVKRAPTFSLKTRRIDFGAVMLNLLSQAHEVIVTNTSTKLRTFKISYDSSRTQQVVHQPADDSNAAAPAALVPSSAFTSRVWFELDLSSGGIRFTKETEEQIEQIEQKIKIAATKKNTVKVKKLTSKLEKLKFGDHPPLSTQSSIGGNHEDDNASASDVLTDDEDDTTTDSGTLPRHQSSASRSVSVTPSTGPAHSLKPRVVENELIFVVEPGRVQRVLVYFRVEQRRDASASSPVTFVDVSSSLLVHEQRNADVYKEVSIKASACSTLAIFTQRAAVIRRTATIALDVSAPSSPLEYASSSHAVKPTDAGSGVSSSQPLAARSMSGLSERDPLDSRASLYDAGTTASSSKSSSISASPAGGVSAQKDAMSPGPSPISPQLASTPGSSPHAQANTTPLNALTSAVPAADSLGQEPFTLTPSALGTGDVLVLSPTEISLGEVDVNCPTQSSFTITNTGMTEVVFVILERRDYTASAIAPSSGHFTMSASATPSAWSLPASALASPIGPSPLFLTSFGQLVPTSPPASSAAAIASAIATSAAAASPGLASGIAGSVGGVTGSAGGFALPPLVAASNSYSVPPSSTGGSAVSNMPTAVGPSGFRFSTLNGSIAPGEQRVISFTFRPQIAGRQRHVVIVRNIHSKTESILTVNVTGRRPQYLRFPELSTLAGGTVAETANPASSTPASLVSSDNDLVFDCGLCYVDRSQRFSKVLPLTVQNLSSKPLVLQFSSNLAKQIFFFVDAAATIPAEDVPCAAEGTVVVHVAIQPQLSEQGREQGACRELIGGVKVKAFEYTQRGERPHSALERTPSGGSVPQTPTAIQLPGAASASPAASLVLVVESVVKLRAVVGQSVARTSQNLLNLGVASELGTVLSGTFVLSNVSTHLPLSYEIVAPNNMTVTPVQGVLAPAGVGYSATGSASSSNLAGLLPAAAQQSVLLECRCDSFGFYQERLRVVNRHHPSRELEIVVRFFVDEGLVDTDLPVGDHGVQLLDFGNVYICPEDAVGLTRGMSNQTPWTVQHHISTDLPELSARTVHRFQTCMLLSSQPDAYRLRPLTDLNLQVTTDFGKLTSSDEDALPHLQQLQGVAANALGQTDVRPCGRTFTLDGLSALPLKVTYPPPLELSRNKWDRILEGETVEYYGILLLERVGLDASGPQTPGALRSAAEDSAPQEADPMASALPLDSAAAHASTADRIGRQMVKVIELHCQFALSVGRIERPSVHLGVVGYRNAWKPVDFYFVVSNLSAVPLYYRSGPISSCITVADLDTKSNGVGCIPAKSSRRFEATLHPRLIATERAGSQHFSISLVNLNNPHNAMQLSVVAQVTHFELNFGHLSATEPRTMRLPSVAIPAVTDAAVCEEWISVQNSVPSDESVKFSVWCELLEPLRDCLDAQLLFRLSTRTVSEFSLATGEYLEMRVRATARSSHRAPTRALLDAARLACEVERKSAGLAMPMLQDNELVIGFLKFRSVHADAIDLLPAVSVCIVGSFAASKTLLLAPTALQLIARPLDYSDESNSSSEGHSSSDDHDDENGSDSDQDFGDERQPLQFVSDLYDDLPTGSTSNRQRRHGLDRRTRREEHKTRKPRRQQPMLVPAKQIETVVLRNPCVNTSVLFRTGRILVKGVNQQPDQRQQSFDGSDSAVSPASDAEDSEANHLLLVEPSSGAIPPGATMTLTVRLSDDFDIESSFVVELQVLDVHPDTSFAAVLEVEIVAHSDAVASRLRLQHSFDYDDDVDVNNRLALLDRSGSGSGSSEPGVAPTRATTDVASQPRRSLKHERMSALFALGGSGGFHSEPSALLVASHPLVLSNQLTMWQQRGQEQQPYDGSPINHRSSAPTRRASSAGRSSGMSSDSMDDSNSFLLGRTQSVHSVIAEEDGAAMLSTSPSSGAGTSLSPGAFVSRLYSRKHTRSSSSSALMMPLNQSARPDGELASSPGSADLLPLRASGVELLYSRRDPLELCATFIMLHRCAPVMETHVSQFTSNFELDLGQLPWDSGSVQREFVLENLSFERVEYRLRLLRAEDRQWLSLSRVEGVLAPNSLRLTSQDASHTVSITVSTSRPGVQTTFIVLDNLTNTQDLKTIRVTAEVVFALVQQTGKAQKALAAPGVSGASANSVQPGAGTASGLESKSSTSAVPVGAGGLGSSNLAGPAAASSYSGASMSGVVAVGPSAMAVLFPALPSGMGSPAAAVTMSTSTTSTALTPAVSSSSNMFSHPLASASVPHNNDDVASPILLHGSIPSLEDVSTPNTLLSAFGIALAANDPGAPANSTSLSGSASAQSSLPNSSLLHLSPDALFTITVEGLDNGPAVINLGDVFYGHTYMSRSFIIQNRSALPLEFLLSSNLPSDDPTELVLSLARLSPKLCKTVTVDPQSFVTVFVHLFPQSRQTVDPSSASFNEGIWRQIEISINCRLIKNFQRVVTVQAMMRHPAFYMPDRSCFFKGRINTAGGSDAFAIDPSTTSLILENRASSAVGCIIRNDTMYFDVSLRNESAAVPMNRVLMHSLESNSLYMLCITLKLDTIRANLRQIMAEKYLYEHITIYNRRRSTEKYIISLRLAFGHFSQFHRAPGPRNSHLYSSLEEHVVRFVAAFNSQLRPILHLCETDVSTTSDRATAQMSRNLATSMNVPSSGTSALNKSRTGTSPRPSFTSLDQFQLQLLHESLEEQLLLDYVYIVDELVFTGLNSFSIHFLFQLATLLFSLLLDQEVFTALGPCALTHGASGRRWPPHLAKWVDGLRIFLTYFPSQVDAVAPLRQLARRLIASPSAAATPSAPLSSSAHVSHSSADGSSTTR